MVSSPFLMVNSDEYPYLLLFIANIYANIMMVDIIIYIIIYNHIYIYMY